MEDKTKHRAIQPLTRIILLHASILILTFSLLHSVPLFGRTADMNGPVRDSAHTLKIASLSSIPVKWDKEANLKNLEKMAREAAAAGAQLLITPEGQLEGYLIDELIKSPEREKWEPKFREIAEPVDGPSVMKVRSLARELGVDLVLGFLERDGEILYNSCAWIDKTGSVLHVHRKTQLAEPYFDPEYYHPGYEIKAFDTRFGRCGMMICFERQIAEVAGVLALDGARLLINPSYGSRGEWNNAILRARARDNEAWLVFTHPKQTLVISPAGEILVDKDREEGAGIVYSELKIGLSPAKKLAKRRSEPFEGRLESNVPGADKRLSGPGKLKVATVQMHATHDLKENVARICRHLADCSGQGVRVAVFPECATTGYFREEIASWSEKDLLDAEKEIAAACLKHGIYAVVGTPYFENGIRYNFALVISPEGKTIYRQAKVYLVGGDKPWAQPGKKLGIFNIDNHVCSVIVCHDSRYPEMVRLPVMKGARLVFYLSCESDIRSEEKMEPYRAQVVARAVENNVYIVQANTPQKMNPVEGSHGQSRIVDPNGQLIREASVFDEEVLVEVLDLTRATGKLPANSLESPFLKDWWRKGLEMVEENER